MMANATRDPYWRAKVAAELHRNPGLAEEINDKCSRCHAPMANDSAKKDGAKIEILGTGFLSADNPYHNEAMDGVSCSLCHQISDDGKLGTLEGGSGGFTVVQQANKVDRPAYGQYADPITGPMQTNVEFTPQLGVHMGKSELCAACHDLKTPFVDADGNPASTTAESQFPEQMVYTEWKNSAFAGDSANGKTCQSCHMPTVDEPVNIATRPRSITPRDGFRLHRFIGANTTMLGILDDNRVALGVTAQGFDTAILETRQMLKSAASIDIPSASLEEGRLTVDLKITNHSGHKLPSGYPSRRVFIHLTVKDADSGKVLFESGKMNADGSITGADNDVDNKLFEPHYDVITRPEQVQIYEPIMQDTDGKVTHTLLRAASYIKDNRLTPAGFDKRNVPGDVAVKGAAMSDDDFNLGSDTITYRIDTGDAKNVTVEAELVYQSLSYGHLQDLFDDSDNASEIASFEKMFENARIRGEIITSISAQISPAGLKITPSGTDDNSGSTPNPTTSGGTSGGGGAGSWLWLAPFFPRLRRFFYRINKR